MIQDVYDPLEKYRDEFREKFASLAREKFEDLAAKSGVDAEKNKETTRQIAELWKKISSEKKKLFFKNLLIFILAACAVAAGVFAYNFGWNADGILSGGGCALCIFGLFRAFKSRADTSNLVAELKEKAGKLEREAWAQMRPLNELYTWDIPVKLIEKTVPRLAFDPYFTASRLDDLRRQFGWSDSFNEDKSILFAQSGAINGNAFALGEYITQTWGAKTYYGRKTIHWTDWETGSDGRRRMVRKSQTLTASITKPIPVYTRGKILIYGNDAAPNLNFSRSPSRLSNGSGVLNSLRKKRELRRLKAYSQNLDDDSQYTLMSNHEFETLFHAKDRDNEVEFRLLFTALAQTQMLKIMKDGKVGYGDDFYFKKRGKINMLTSAHLDGAAIDTDPKRFRNFDFEKAKENFLSFNEKYFKDVYFAFAPALSIPLYQQTRTGEDIYGHKLGERASFWEHEAIANFYGCEKFSHPQCATRSILKTSALSRENGVTKIQVEARGYSANPRLNYVEAYGGDGHWHEVPVEWIEYLPVSRTSSISVAESGEGENPPPKFGAGALFRRGIYSMLG
ncbi:MAG: hypothetical protein IKO42_03825 [Opitutales bacterium]|nr:hypothetical protein [Opitutales bacterium]